MPNVKFKHYLHLHFLVFIAGFTAILGELITIGSLALVWFRMAIAGVLMFLYIRLIRLNLKIDKKWKKYFLFHRRRRPPKGRRQIDREC